MSQRSSCGRSLALIALMIVFTCCIANKEAKAVDFNLPPEALGYNIHVKLTPDVAAIAEAANDFIEKYCPGNDVHLRTVEQPHITLYLTEFLPVDKEQLVAAVHEAVKTIPATPCIITTEKSQPSGTYLMWEVNTPPCLQFYSDVIVNATTQFAVPNQTVPAWVLTLPEPLRSEKIAMIKKFGSPNVFSQFQPHVTLGFDNNTACLTAVAPQLTLPLSHFAPTTLAIGTTGPHGTVLRGEDVADFSLQKSQVKGSSVERRRK